MNGDKVIRTWWMRYDMAEFRFTLKACQKRLKKALRKRSRRLTFLYR